MKSLSYIILALVLGCGGNSSSGNHRDSSRPCPDMNSVYDQSSGKNNKKDMKDYDISNGDLRRDGVGNTRNDVYSDSFDSGCPDLGSDEGLEGRLDLGADSGRDDMTTGNIPPVANAGPDLDLEARGLYCVVFDYDACVAEGYPCRNGPFAPGHGRFSTGSYDPDGEIVSYRYLFDYENNPDVGVSGPCGGLPLYDPGRYILRLVVTDNESTQDHDDTVINVE